MYVMFKVPLMENGVHGGHGPPVLSPVVEEQQ